MTTAVLDDGVEEFLAALAAERRLSPNTVAAYRRDLAQYLEFLAGRRPRPHDVSAFVASLHHAGLAPSTVARKTAAVRMLHRFLVSEGLAGEDPATLVASPRRARSLPKALTVAEVEALLAAPDASTPLGRRDRALLEFLYATGARVAEAVALDLADLDLDGGAVILTGKGEKQRLVPVGRHALTAVADYLPDRLWLTRTRGTDAVFVNHRGGRLSRQGAWQVVRRSADAAGIPTTSVSPHVLRHSAATHMVEGGADLRTVQEMLGHASITTTQVYTKVTPGHLYEVYVTSHPRSQ